MASQRDTSDLLGTANVEIHLLIKETRGKGL
jgi:hypothetical protein